MQWQLERDSDSEIIVEEVITDNKIVFCQFFWVYPGGLYVFTLTYA